MNVPKKKENVEGQKLDAGRSYSTALKMSRHSSISQRSPEILWTSIFQKAMESTKILILRRKTQQMVARRNGKITSKLKFS